METSWGFVFAFWIPFAVLLAGAFMTWRWLRWLGSKILQPLVERQITFMNRVEVFGQQQTGTLQRLEEEFGRMRRALVEIRDLVDQAGQSIQPPSVQPPKG